MVIEKDDSSSYASISTFEVVDFIQLFIHTPNFYTEGPAR